VNFLLLVGANPGGFNTTFSPLHFAARYGQAETSRALLDVGADVNSFGTWQQTPLMEAVQAGDIETVRLLLARGASVTPVDNRSGTALWHATRMHDAAVTRLLMNYGGKDCSDAENALIASVEDSDEETVRALLNGGVDPRRLTATYRLIPLTEFAAQKGQPEIVSMLRAAGAR